VEPCRTCTADYGEATEVGRHQRFPSARDMGSGVESGYGGDHLQAGNYPGVSVEGRKPTEVADSGTGRTSVEVTECF